MKKTNSLRVITLIMAVLVLLSSTGLVIVEHSCLMRGKTQSVWVGKDSCKTSCSSKKNSLTTLHDRSLTYLQKQPCCKESKHLSRVGIATEVNSLPVLVFQNVALPYSFSFLFTPSAGRFAALHQAGRPDPGPLVFSASCYISFLCTWII